jgi:hypothetical protein
MKKLYSALLILSLSSGCVRMQIKPPVETSGKLQTIAVVPMEAPPLEFFPFGEGDASSVHDLMSDLQALNPDKKIPIGMRPNSLQDLVAANKIQIGGGRGQVIIFGISMMMDLMNMKDLLVALQEAPAIAKSMESTLGHEEAWIPTTVLSQEVVGQITLEGKSAVILEENIQEIPGITNRGRTISLENWMAPIRAWYNQDISSFDYQSYRERKVDAVLEVGLSNYTLGGTFMLLQVMMKLIDPMTGQVLGRSRNVGFVEIKKTDKLFIDNGLPFKELFAATGKKPVIEDLKYLGLLPERR